jgi:conjugal transfer ATP-binding protein TraC
VRHELTLGPVRVVARAPAVRWDGNTDAVVVRTASLGFSGASEAERVRWINVFRRLLDGLDAPLQVVIEVEPGAGPAMEDDRLPPVGMVEFRSADVGFREQVSRSPDAHRFFIVLATTEAQVTRLEAALYEMGIEFTTSAAAKAAIFGTEQPRTFLHSGGWSRTWYMERLPGAALEAGWLHRLLPRGLKTTLSWHATPLPVAWVVEYLQRQLVGMRATRLQELSAGTADPALAGALPNAEDLQRRLASSQEKAFHVCTYLTLTSPSSESLEMGARRIEAAARAVLCRLEPCTFRMFDGYLATQPVVGDRLQRKKVLDTSTLATFFPWLDANLNQPGGLVIGRSQATGSPVVADPFDQQRYVNANIGVFGHSGAGKTYLLSALAMGALGLGIQVYVIDPEHEYGALAKQLGGVDVQLALGSPDALNVLELRPSDRRDESWIGPATADAVDLCATICGGIDERERATIETAVRSAYRDADAPVLADVAARLPEDSRVAAILNRWVKGSLGRIFSAHTNIDLDAPIVAFGMRELRDEMVAPVHFLLAEALWTRIKRKDRRRMLVVDELGLLFEDPTIRRFVVSLARRIRKYDGSLVFATHNPGDLLSSDQGAVVATNPSLLFLGAQRSGEAAKLQRAFHLSRPQRAFLETARRGDFLLAAGAERLVVEVKAPPWQEDAMRRARDQGRRTPA